MDKELAGALPDLLDRPCRAVDAARFVAAEKVRGVLLPCVLPGAAHCVHASAHEREVIFHGRLCFRGGGRCGRWGTAPRKLVQVLQLRVGAEVAVGFVRLVPPAIPQRERCPEAVVVGVVQGVRRADEPDARAGVRPAPRLVVRRKFVPLRILDRLPVVEDRLLRRLQLREVLARQLHHHGAIDLLRARMLSDDLRESVHG